MKKIGIIIYARTSSKRLPNKVLKSILDKPMLLYHIKRLWYSKMIDKLLVATSDEASDDSFE